MSSRLSKVIPLLFVLTVISVALADSGPEHRAAQPRPIYLGTSGGNILLRSDQYCCGGTLGALVQRDDIQYILSNNHVLGRINQADPGEPVNQPGMIDQGCAQEGIVAHFSEHVEILFKDTHPGSVNYIDAAIAQVVDGAVDSEGAILDIGAISEATEPILTLVVEKSGRTTGNTLGVVLNIGVSVDVNYSMGCGSGVTRQARFADQMMITGLTRAFSAGGDSGSLIVEGMEPNPRAVGLLFAGNSLYTIANPITRVLDSLNVTFPGGDGGTTEPPPLPTETGFIFGEVRAIINKKNTAPLAGAAVTLGDGTSVSSDDNGWYDFENIPVGEISVTASADGYKSQTKTVTVVANAETNADFTLRISKSKGKPRNRSAIERVLKIKKKHEKKFFDIEDVVGSGVGLSKDLKPAIKIYLKKDSQKARKKIPKMIDGIPVEIIVTGEFQAF